MRLIDADALFEIIQKQKAWKQDTMRLPRYGKGKYDAYYEMLEIIKNQPTIDVMIKSDEKLLGEMLDRLSIRLELINDIAIEWFENASNKESLETQKKMFEIEEISKMFGQKNSEKEIAIPVPMISEVFDDFQKIFEEEKRIIGRKELLSEIKPV